MASPPPSSQNVPGVPIKPSSPSDTTPAPLVPVGPPATSLSDTGLSTRPRDARTIHMVLASLGVTAYQERVPLQLLDFAYRYTAGVLGDAQHLVAEGYVATQALAWGGKSKNAAAPEEGGVSLSALRLATASRNGYQFSSRLPKETLLEMAAERNRVRLPVVSKEAVFGVRLPHERFVMTGTGWSMLNEWDSEVDEAESVGGEALNGMQVDNPEDTVSGKGVAGEMDGDEVDEDQEMNDRDGFEEVFGRDEAGGGIDDA